MFYKLKDTEYYNNIHFITGGRGFLKSQCEELKRVNKIYYDEIKEYQKKIHKYNEMINQLEDMVVKLSNYIEDKKC